VTNKDKVLTHVKVWQIILLYTLIEGQMNDRFYAHKYHYEHVMCHLFEKYALTFLKPNNIINFFTAFHKIRISLLQT
jgi:hypothetical protein